MDQRHLQMNPVDYIYVEDFEVLDELSLQLSLLTDSLGKMD